MAGTSSVCTHSLACDCKASDSIPSHIYQMETQSTISTACKDISCDAVALSISEIANTNVILILLVCAMVVFLKNSTPYPFFYPRSLLRLRCGRWPLMPWIGVSLISSLMSGEAKVSSRIVSTTCTSLYCFDLGIQSRHHALTEDNRTEFAIAI